jgi:MFS family permease
MLQKLFSLESRFAVYLFSQRRNFIPLLSIYFLTLSDTNAQQIWVFMWLGFLASFLLEIPSAYFADRFWHKRTLILSKIFQGLSLLFFICAAFIDTPQNYYIFILWSITQAFWFSFFSGTTIDYFHELL